MPTSVVTNVKVLVWKEVMEGFRYDSGEFLLMWIVLDDLTLGCDSRVGKPGNRPSVTKNFFKNRKVDLPRILDALATKIKAQHMAGPLGIGTMKDAKVCGLISVVKPGGDRRQVGNLSAPKVSVHPQTWMSRGY